mmetsp:Transcript_79653/g.129149  ORF Transcript_79653/g.129149 Transcript_79653/m.129149 type:complete len:350 (-) Transcript_79653:1725-2774(-)
MKYCIFNGHLCFRERIFLSFISKKTIYLENIRNRSQQKGLRNYELDLFSLIDKIFYDCSVQINEIGTKIKFIPGSLKDGNFFHNTIGTRALSYYLEFLAYLIPSINKRINIKIVGLRSLKSDISLETFAYVNLTLLRKIGRSDVRMRIITNLISNTKNTEVILFSSKMNLSVPFQFNRRGFILALQIIFTTSSDSVLTYEDLSSILPKSLMNCELNFKIHNFKVYNTKISFKTITLIAETSTGCILSTDSTLTKKNVKFTQWLDFYRDIFSEFLEQLISGSCVDGVTQVPLLINFLNEKSKKTIEVKVKNLTLSSIQFLREVKLILGPVFGIKFLKDSKKIVIQKKTIF